MTDPNTNQSKNSGPGGGLYFAVGALVVAVLVIGYVVLGGGFSGGQKSLDVNVTVPEGDNTSTQEQAPEGGEQNPDTGSEN